MTCCRALLLLLTLLLLPSLAWAQPDLSAYRNKNRLLLVFAPSKSDSRWQRQDKLLARSRAAFAHRELLRWEIFPRSGQGPRGPLTASEALALRKRYKVKPGQFRVLLVGKDGHIAFGGTSPIALDKITGRIDQMPMRRDEMRRRGSAT